ncbi:MAG TPA: hypothetical protein VGH11_16260 [Jatrophihabitans sp.]
MSEDRRTGRRKATGQYAVTGHSAVSLIGSKHADQSALGGGQLPIRSREAFDE